MNKAYERITNKIIDSLQEGVIPWRKPWAGYNSMPKNPVSGTRYSGLNIFLLACSPFNNPNWLTFNQAKKAGGTIKKGEKGTPVIFWKFAKKENGRWQNADPREDEDALPILRYYTVFNAEQCEGIPDKLSAMPEATTYQHDKINAAEKIVSSFVDKPAIRHKLGDRASYNPSKDLITMPEMSQFEITERYYSTLFHEMAHSTGHESRLARKEITDLVQLSSAYGEEELTAEMAAAFLCSDAGIDNSVIDNAASYIDSWLKVLKQPRNAKMIVMAASRAKKAADYILGKHAKKSAAA